MTVRHLVMLRRLPDVSEDRATEVELTTRLDALGAAIPGIKTWLLAANEHDRPLCWDYVLEADLADETALEAYLSDPAHQALLPALRAYFELAVVDHDPEASR